MVWYSHLFQNFPQLIVIHTVKGFSIVNKAEIDVFLELSCFFDDPVDVGNLISGSSAFSKTSLNIWKFTVDVLLKAGLENFEYYFTSTCNGGSDSKASVYNAGDQGLSPGLGRISWRRKWQSTPVLLPGKSHEQKSLVGYSPWGRKESDTTERLHFT